MIAAAVTWYALLFCDHTSYLVDWGFWYDKVLSHKNWIKVKHWLGPFSNLTVDEDGALGKMRHLSFYHWLSCERKRETWLKWMCTKIKICIIFKGKTVSINLTSTRKVCSVQMLQLCPFKKPFMYLTYWLYGSHLKENICKITFHTVWTPALSLCVFITREISKNVLSLSVRHSLTEFLIPVHINFFVMGHCSERVDQSAAL